MVLATTPLECGEDDVDGAKRENIVAGALLACEGAERDAAVDDNGLSQTL